MFDTPAHIGTEHPNLLWIAASSLLAFAAGLGVALFRDEESQTEPVSQPEDQ